MTAEFEKPSASAPSVTMSARDARRTFRRVVSLLLFIGTTAVLIWGAWWQPPRKNPFETPDILTWLFTPEPHRALASMPVVPSGRLTFNQRDLCKDLQGCGSLQKLPDGTFILTDSGTVQQNADAKGPQRRVRDLYWSQASSQIFALTEQGQLFSLAEGSPPRWRSFPLPRIQEEKTELQLHQSLMASACFSPDGTLLLAGYDDGTTRVWDTTQGTLIRIIQEGQRFGPVTTVTFSPDGTHFARGSRFGGIEVYERGGTLLFSITTHSTIASATFSPDGKRIMSILDGSTLQIWDTSNGAALATFSPHRGAILSAVYSPDGLRILTASDDGTAATLDSNTGTVLLRLKVQAGAVRSASFSPDGAHVVTVSSNGFVQTWDSQTGKSEREFSAGTSAILSVAYSSDGSEIMVASQSTIEFWGANNDASERGFPSTSSFGEWVALSRDGSMFAYANGNERFGLIRRLSTAPVVTSVTSSDAGTLWLVGTRGFLSSSKDGRTWHSNAPNDHVFVRVSAVGPDLGIVLGQDKVLYFLGLRVEDVGQTGIQAKADSPSTTRPSLVSKAVRIEPVPNQSLHSLEFVSETEGWVVGDNGLILYTNDGGAHWTTLHQQVGLQLTDIHVERAGVGWAIGKFADGRIGVVAANRPSAPSGPDGWEVLPNYLAPWYFLLGVPTLLLAGFMLLRSWRPDPPQPYQSIEEVANSDTPLRWSDADARTLRPLARGLSRFLRNVNTQPPLTLAVTGRWGSGKSSLMSLLMSDLQRYGGRAVWFNAWHHNDEEHLLASLFEAIRRDAPPGWWSWPGLAFRCRLFWRRSRYSLLNMLYIVLFIAIVITTIRTALPPFHVEELDNITRGLVGAVGENLAKSWGTIAAAALGGTTGIIALASLWLRGKLVALPANPAKLALGLARRASIGDFSDKLAFRHRFGEQFDDVCNALLTRTSPGLVILIDDLDRCPPDDVLKILEAVNYLVSAGPCIIVLGMDRRQIEYCVGLGFEKLVEGLPEEEMIYATSETPDKSGKQRAFARHYLEKLINIEVPIPMLDDSATEAMLSRAQDDGGPDDSDAPAWIKNTKQIAVNAFQIARVGLIAFFLGMLLTAAVERIRDANPMIAAKLTVGPSPASSTAQTSSIGTVSRHQAEKKPDSTSDEFVAARVKLESPPATAEIPPPRRWLWWGPTLLAIGLALLFGIAATLRRQRQIVKDSPDFEKALHSVKPVFVAVRATPRAIKRFQNRMRYLAARLRPAGYEPDVIDAALRWIGMRLGKTFVPPSWFEGRPTHGISEPSLILLGAVELVAPESFANSLELYTKVQSGSPAENLPEDLENAWKQLRTGFAAEGLSMPTLVEIARYATFVLNDFRPVTTHRADIISLVS
jgi:WD40 repeat protein